MKKNIYKNKNMFIDSKKEEYEQIGTPFDETIDYSFKELIQELPKTNHQIPNIILDKVLFSKQETLEEAENEFEKLLNGKGLPTKQLTEVAEHYFIVGYEIAKEKSYSEEEVLKSVDNLGFKQITSKELNSLPYQPFVTDEDGNVWVIDKEKWFEQFKKNRNGGILLQK